MGLVCLSGCSLPSPCSSVQPSIRQAWPTSRWQPPLGGTSHPTALCPPCPWPPQNFLYEKGLQNLPIYTLGISAGAGFATKLPKAFFDTNFGGIIKLGGIISGGGAARSCSPHSPCFSHRTQGAAAGAGKLGPAQAWPASVDQAGSPRLTAAEVNAPGTWKSWGLIGKDGNFKFPDFPPVAFIMMQARTAGAARVPACAGSTLGCGGRVVWLRSRHPPPPLWSTPSPRSETMVPAAPMS